ncbi:MAG TPA: DNA polymerase ligase N-terminal domain-containing protein [Sedimentisphaerales bacterium]|nr:DNA polymerase ligase N-terminal domain-containing protein [Sedimentisphaerales bacterium]HNU29191.1 DNA polymerase ligase N-terminal domain-containing protein [Sedimentisphaerales bacterium]
MSGSRFVVQQHTTIEGVHWDLMLEQDGVLTTFRLEAEPAQAMARAVRAVKIFDHPLRFLTYEGPVQKGTGKVRIVDSGSYSDRDRRDDLRSLTMNGAILNGDFTLSRIENAEWRFTARSTSEQG